MLGFLDQTNRRLIVGLLVNFILFGLVVSIRGPTVPSVIRTFGWTYTITGVVLAASSIGYFVSTFLCGILIKRFGSKRIICACLFFEAICLTLFARHPSALLNTLLNFGIGIGFGATEVVTNYQIIFLERRGESRLMNFVHSAFCVGAVIGPPAVAGLLRSPLGWESIFALSALLVAGMGVLFVLTPFTAIDIPEETTAGKPRRSYLNAILMVLFVSLFLYVGIEIGVSNWLSEYFIHELDASLSTGAVIGGAFWLGILLGRIGLSVVYRGTGQTGVLFGLSCGSCICLLLLIISKRIFVSALLLFFTGVALSGIFPLIMAIVGMTFRDGVAVGVVASGGGIGAFCFPFLIAVLADFIGFHGAFVFCFGVSIAMTILTFILLLACRKRSFWLRV